MARHDVDEQADRMPVPQRQREPIGGAAARAEHLAETGELDTDGLEELPVYPVTVDEYTPEADAKIREIADKLPPEVRAQFMAAIDKIRTEAGKGKVRLKDPTPEEQKILDTFRSLGTIKKTVEALGLPHHRVHYVVTRKFAERPITARRTTVKATPPLLAFIREGHAAGVPLMALAPEVERISGKSPSRETMERLAGEAGVYFAPPRLDPTRLDEMVGDVIALERKYGVSIGTICVKFYEHTRAVVDRDKIRGATV